MVQRLSYSLSSRGPMRTLGSRWSNFWQIIGRFIRAFTVYIRGGQTVRFLPNRTEPNRKNRFGSVRFYKQKPNAPHGGTTPRQYLPPLRVHGAVRLSPSRSLPRASPSRLSLLTAQLLNGDTTPRQYLPPLRVHGAVRLSPSRSLPRTAPQ
ncbi:hypothetical protein WN943_012955 [Citrus x changshan-huyou]